MAEIEGCHDMAMINGSEFSGKPRGTCGVDLTLIAAEQIFYAENYMMLTSYIPSAGEPIPLPGIGLFNSIMLRHTYQASMRHMVNRSQLSSNFQRCLQHIEVALVAERFVEEVDRKRPMNGIGHISPAANCLKFRKLTLTNPAAYNEVEVERWQLDRIHAESFGAVEIGSKIAEVGLA
jgi:hypothetical protein